MSFLCLTGAGVQLDVPPFLVGEFYEISPLY